MRREQIGSTIQVELRLVAVDGAPVTGQSPTVAVRRWIDNYFLDWADNSFKLSGWTTKNQLLTEVTGVPELIGMYRASWPSAVPVLAQGYYSFEFFWSDGSVSRRMTESVEFVSSHQAEKILGNRLSIDFTAGVVKIYEEDGITVAWQAPLSDKSGNPVSASAVPDGAIVHRGSPL